MNCSTCKSFFPGCAPEDCGFQINDNRPFFAKISTEPDAILPTRATEMSAGYDIFSNATVEIQPFSVAMIPTGVKIRLSHDKYLQISLRSSVAIKRAMIMPNSPGIIDADYYNNQDNEGHIFVAIMNLSSVPQVIEKHTRIAQGVILPYFKTKNDHAVSSRIGGIGSTGEK